MPPPARIGLILAGALLAAAGVPGPRLGAEPPLAEHRIALVVPSPAGPAILEVAALGPAGRVHPAELAAAIAAAHPGAIPLSAPGASAAYVLDRVRWRNPVVPWWYAPQGSTPSLDGADAMAQVLAGAEAWRFAGGTTVRFDYRGETATPTGCRGDPAHHPYTRDDLNVVGWGTVPGGYLAYACWWRSPSLVEGTPYFELLEFDIVIDPAYPYTSQLLRRLAMHEFGHALGLAHSDACPGAVMCAGEQGLLHDAPQPDDIAGLVALYGRAPPPPLERRAILPLVSRD